MSLLDDVSIVVTPNGYKAGELYAVLPVPTEGAELVTNGDFSTDANWTKNSGWTISGGSANCDGTQTGNSGLVQQNGIAGVSLDLQIGKQYKMVIDVTVISGAITYIEVASDYQNDDINATGVSTLYFSPTSTNDRITIAANSTFVGSVNSVSVKEYTAADMDVTRATAATRVDEAGLVNYAEILGSEEVTNGSFTGVVDGTDVITLSGWSAYNSPTSRNVVDNKLVIVQNGANQGAIYNTGSLAGNYKLTVDVSGDTGLQGIYIGGTGLNVGVNTYLGKLVYYFTASSSLQIYFRAGNNSAGNTTSYTNISVKESTRDNVPRIDYSGGGCPHILAEPQRTNLLPYSEDFSQWSAISGASVAINTAISPSGETDADTITYDGTTYGRVEKGIAVTNGNTYTSSFYLKNNNLSDVTQVWLGFSMGGQGEFVTITNEWQRYETVQVANGNNEYPRVQFTGTGSLYVWGAQMEEGSYATSYIPTSGSTVTRNQDIFSRDGIGSLINSAEGVLFAEIAAFADNGTFRVLAISDGTNNNTLKLGYRSDSNAIYVEIKSASAGQVFLIYTTTDITDFHKVAVKYKVNDFALWINGVEVLTDTSGNTPIGLNRIALDRGDGFSNFYGKVKQLQVYKTALTDTQLAALTS